MSTANDVSSFNAQFNYTNVGSTVRNGLKFVVFTHEMEGLRASSAWEKVGADHTSASTPDTITRKNAVGAEEKVRVVMFKTAVLAADFINFARKRPSKTLSAEIQDIVELASDPSGNVTAKSIIPAPAAK